MISLYDKGNDNYTANGNVVLQPLECKHKQVAAGSYDLTLKCRIDPEGKWKHIVPEAIIQAPVPKETITTAYSGMEVDLYQTTEAAALREGPSEPTAITYSEWSALTVYQVGSKVTCSGNRHKNYQCNTWDGTSSQTMVPPYASNWWVEIADYTSGSPVLINLKDDTQLYYVSGPEDGWYKMSTTYGMEGYIKESQVEYVRHLTPEETQPHTITTQLFRIKTVNVDSKSRTVTATAEHVSYDLGGVLVEDAEIHQKNPAMALALIESSFMIDYKGIIGTDMTSDDDGTYTGDIKGKNAIYALLDPDKGIVSSFDARYRRDNWDVFVMRKDADAEAKLQLRYGKNMLGVSWNIKTDGLITRVVPVAKAEDGSDLYLDRTVGQETGIRWVDSPHINEYDVIYMERLKVSGQVGKDDGTETDTVWTEQTLRAEMETKAEEQFSIDKVDLIVYEITIDFEMLGDTVEYSELKDLEQVIMYDKVIAINEQIDLDAEVEVSEIEYDCIREKITALKLTNVTRHGDRTVSGFNVWNNSITGDKLTDDVSNQMTGGILEDANGYTDGKISGLNYSLRQWVNQNFEPISSGT